MTEMSVELGAHGRTFATRDRAREIAALIRRDYQPHAREVLLDLSSVVLAGSGFMNEFAGEMGALWPRHAGCEGAEDPGGQAALPRQAARLRMRAAADQES